MNDELLLPLRAAQQEIDPQFRALRNATGVLQQAIKLASEETADALAMQKVLVKFEQVGQTMDDEKFGGKIGAAKEAFANATHKALDSLAFEFARDLKHAFEERGRSVEGRPPTLVIDNLVLQIDIAARKAQWLYGKEQLTSPIALSINAITKAYDNQRKAILDRKIDVAEFLTDVYKAWKELLEEKIRTNNGKSVGNRINSVEVYRKVVMNRQSQRFWSAPSASNFKDYPRPLFVRDVMLAQPTPTVTIEEKSYRLRLSTATKSQADSASRSIWLPNGALDGEYYGDMTFEEVS